MLATAPDDTLGAKYMPDKTELQKKFPDSIMILCHNCWRPLLGSSARREQCPKKVDIHLHHRTTTIIMPHASGKPATLGRAPASTTTPCTTA